LRTLKRVRKRLTRLSKPAEAKEGKKELNLRRNRLGMMVEEAKTRREKAEDAEEAEGKKEKKAEEGEQQVEKGEEKARKAKRS
jgi:hypothetical protein